MGKLYGVSIGAGDPQLMTLKTVRILKDCGIIAAPRTNGKESLALSIAAQAVDMSGKHIVYLDYPMTRDSELIDRNCGKAADMLCAELEKGDVAVPTLGDISVYSTFMRTAGIVRVAGFDVEICAGVTSFSAAASALGIPLCLGNDPLHIIPYGCENMEKLLDMRGTKVIMKAGRHAGKLIELLRRKGLAEQTFAAENCGLPDERLYRSLDDIDGETGYFTVFIVSDKESAHEA